VSLGGAFIVKCGDGDFSVSRKDGMVWECEQWQRDDSPQIGYDTAIEMATTKRDLCTAAASLELPTANPAASAKETDVKRFPDHLANADWRADKERVETDVEGLCHTMREHEAKIESLESNLERYRVRLDRVEAKFNKGN